MNVHQLREIQEMLQLPVEQRPERIARLVHLDQVDKALRPYIDHPRRVSENVQVLAEINQISELQTEHLIAASWLHDVIEDSGLNSWPKVSATDLATWGIPSEVIQLVLLLTRTYEFGSNVEVDGARYYLGIKENKLARLAKIADMADNCNRQRVKWLRELGKESKVSRYLPALEELALTEEEQSWFEERVNSSCELNALDDEEYLRYFIRHEKLYALGDNLIQGRFLIDEGLWVQTFDLLDWIIKGDFDLDQVTLKEAKRLFERAFPIQMKEGQ